jgi:ankyrin repeat protein
MQSQKTAALSPLDVALIANDGAAVIHLLDAEPGQVNQENTEGRTPLDMAVSRSSVDLVELLIRRGAIVNKRGHVDGAFPLLQAVARKRKDVVELLLKNGADPTMSHKEWGTALDLAVILDQAEIAEVFHNFTKAADSKVMVSFPKDVDAQIRATARRMIDEELDVADIPKADGMVLVRLGTAAYQQRLDAKTSLMMPAPETVDGCRFVVCSE